MNQCAARTTVAVRKRVDRLELCVHERSLNKRRKQVVVDCIAQVVEQTLDFLRWRWDEVGTTRIVVVPAYPVLACTDLARYALGIGSWFHETPVDRDDLSDREALRLCRLIHGQLHGIDVCQNLESGRTSLAAGLDFGLRACQLAESNLHSLDLR